MIDNIRFNEFLKKIDFNPSQDQEKVIISTENSVCSANAGSGKTAVLALRYLYMIIASNEEILPERILALTFTRKAAAEMRERIGQYMSIANREGIISDDAYESFSNAVVSTIDSFLTDIVKSRSSQFDIIPRCFDEYNPEDFPSERAYQDFLREAKDIVNSLNDLARFTRIQRRDIFSNILEKTVVSLPPGDLNTFDAHKALSELEKKLEKSENAEAEFNKIVDFLNANNTKRSQKFNNSLSNLNKVKDNYEIPIDSIEYIPDKILDLLEQKFNLKDKMALLEKMQILQMAVLFERKRDEYEKVAENINRIVRFIQEWKLKNAAFTYSDISSMALHILKNDLEVRNFYKQKFSRIMIDEFQDNNSVQRDILYLLSGKPDFNLNQVPTKENLVDDKLLFVGDDKQSIYKFRGADVKVFKELKKDFPSQLPIADNYRSSEKLINFYNKVFKGHISGLSMNKPFEADFSKEMRHGKKTEGGESNIELALYKGGGKTEETTETEARFIADRIVKMVTDENDPYHYADGKALTFGDIMILYKTKTHKKELEAELNRRHIPFNEDGPSNLKENTITRDFVSLFSTFFYSDDMASKAAVLLSPFVRLERESLFRILNSKDEMNSIFNGSTLDMEWMDTEERNHLKSFSRLYQKWSSKLMSDPLSDLLQEIWIDGGYKKYLMDNGLFEHAVIFDYLLALAEYMEKQGKSPYDFLNRLRKKNEIKNSNIDDFPYLTASENAVNLMTIHKAKGLQAKVVIIYQFGVDTTRENTNKTDFDKQFIPAEDGSFSLAPVAVNRLFAEKEYEEDKAERKRLFYVALTRAECHLLMVASLTKDEDKYEFLKWVRNAIPEGEAEGILDYTEIKRADKYLSFKQERDEDDIRPLSLCGDFSAAVTSLENAYKGQEGGISHPDGELEQIIASQPTVFGSLVHELIENRIKDCDHQLDEYRFCEDDALNEKILHYAEEMVSGFVCSQFYKELLKDSLEVFTEKGFFVSRDFVEKVLPEAEFTADVYEGRIDLAVVKDSEVIVVDYKTDRDVVPEAHRNQMLVYMTAAKELYGKDKVRGYLYYLRDKKEISVELNCET